MMNENSCEKNSAVHECMKSSGILALRLIMAFIFVYSGYNKLFPMHEMAVKGFGAMGFPMPEFWVWLVGIVEFVGGIMLALGVYAVYAAAPLAITMIVAIFVAHWGGPINGYFTPLALLGGLASLMGTGSGKYRLVKTECHWPAACATSEKENAYSDGKDAGGRRDAEIKK